MVNMQPGNDGDEQWYPQLPEGYAQQPMQYGMDYGYNEMSQGMGMHSTPGYQADPMHGYSTPGYQADPMYGYDSMGQFDQMTAINGFPGFPGFGPGGGGMPPFGPPGFPPGQGGPQFGPPGQQQGQQGPSSPPPSFTPPYPSSRGGAQLFAVDPGAIRGCLYRNTYIWTSRRNGFWMFPTFVGRTSVAGWRWRSNRRRWEYTGIDLNRIDQFSCF